MSARMPRPFNPRSAFTLIEIMVVVCIMGIVMTMGVPLVYKVFHKAPFTKAITDVVEVCSHARARAILQGSITEVVFHPQDGRLEISGGGAPAPATPGDGGPISFDANPKPRSGSGTSAQIALDHVAIEMLDVNLIEYKDQELARVRFYPNGTCDELTIILRSDRGEWKKISLEVTTGLANVGDIRE